MDRSGNTLFYIAEESSFGIRWAKLQGKVQNHDKTRVLDCVCITNQKCKNKSRIRTLFGHFKNVPNASSVPMNQCVNDCSELI